jgi:hypothetical protein
MALHPMRRPGRLRPRSPKRLIQVKGEKQMVTEPKPRALRKLRKRPPNKEADDLRIEAITAQLEEIEQQRLTDYWIEPAQSVVPR